MKTVKVVLLIISASFFIGLAVVITYLLFFFWGMKKSNTPATDQEKYEAVLTMWEEDKSEEYIRHFPRPIPRDAGNVRFYYIPNFLQRDAWIELHYQTGEEEIQELYEKYDQLKTGTSATSADWWFRTLSEDESWQPRQMPKDFEVFTLHSNPDQAIEHDPRWGVAISRESNTIIYWADR